MRDIVSVKHGIEGGYEVSTEGGQIAHVPNDSENSDYIKVEVWEAEGGVVTAADPEPGRPSLADATADRRAGDSVFDDLARRVEALENP